MSYNRKALNVDLGKYKKDNAFKKDIEVNPRGQWDGKGIYRIPSNTITMEGVDFPVWMQPNVGPGMVMYPGENKTFEGADYVDEYPLAKRGGALKKQSKKISAKNKLFTKNDLFKTDKHKIYNPKAQEGTEVTTPPTPVPEPVPLTTEDIIRATLEYEKTAPTYKNEFGKEPDYSKMEAVKQVVGPRYLNESITLPYNLGVYKKDNYEVLSTPEGYKGLTPVVINGKRFYINNAKDKVYDKAYEQFVNEYMKVYKRDPMLGKSEYYFRFIEPPKVLQDGGEQDEEFELDLTPEEIEWFVSQGYDFEYLD